MYNYFVKLVNLVLGK